MIGDFGFQDNLHAAWIADIGDKKDTVCVCHGFGLPVADENAIIRVIRIVKQFSRNTLGIWPGDDACKGGAAVQIFLI